MVASNFAVTPLAGGTARCKDIDEFVYDNYVANHRQISPGGLNALEADWIASADRLFYVTPRVLSCLSWSWSEFLTITKTKHRLLKSFLEFRFKDPSEEPVVMEMSNSAAQRLLSLWQTM
jgi:hypothetical protein